MLVTAHEDRRAHRAGAISPLPQGVHDMAKDQESKGKAEVITTARKAAKKGGA